MTQQTIPAVLDEQIEWYKKSSDYAMWRYRIARIVEIVCAALIPLCTGMDGAYYRTAAGILGVAVVIVTAMHGLFRWHENWIRWRVTMVALMKEKWLYSANVEPFDNADLRDKELAKRLAEIVDGENRQWKESPKKELKDAPKSEAPKINT